MVMSIVSESIKPMPMPNEWMYGWKPGTPFIPAPVGTIRGPYSCGFGYSQKGVSFCVQGPNGWVYFMEPILPRQKIQAGERARRRAKQYSKELYWQNIP
jgi:hypothetical protein